MEVTSMYKTSSSSIYKSTKSRNICRKLLKILICILEISWNYQIVYSYTHIYSFFSKTTTTLYQITTVVRSSSHLFLFKEGLDFFYKPCVWDHMLCYISTITMLVTLKFVCNIFPVMNRSICYGRWWWWWFVRNETQV